MKRIGIDVGGTNTDAVLLVDDKVAGAVKTPTTADVTSGVRKALADLIAAQPQAASGLDAVMIGTTHFTNAVVQRRDLMKVAAIRIGLPASASLPPFCDWPADLAELVRGEIIMLEGGHEFDGRPIVPFDERGMREAAKRIRAPASRVPRSPRCSRPSTRRARRAPPRSCARRCPTSASPARTISGASACWSARTSRC